MNQKSRIEEVNVVFLFTVLTYIVVNGVIGFLYWKFGVSLSSFQSILVAQVTLILPSLYYVIKNKINIKQLIRFHKIKITTIVLLIPFALCIAPLMNYISYISMLFFSNHIGSTVDSLITNTNFFFAFLLVAFVPALLEESVYRGVFYNEYSRVSVKKGILLSALMFGMLHMNMNQFLYAFVVGIIFAFLVEATDSILSAMIVHFVINGSSILASKTAQASDVLLQREDLLTIIQELLLPVVIATLIALVLFYIIAISNNRWSHIQSIFSREEKKEFKLSSIPLVLGVVICVIEMIGRG